MKMTSAYANKLLKQLDEEKVFLQSMEKSGCFFIAVSKDNRPDTDYNYAETEKRLEEITDRIVKIKHAISLSNITTSLTVGDEVMTVDEILVRMAQLNKRKNVLDSLRKMRDGERQPRGVLDLNGGGPEYKFLAFSIKEVREDYSRISREIMQMQLALDRHNQLDEFEVDVQMPE